MAPEPDTARPTNAAVVPCRATHKLVHTHRHRKGFRNGHDPPQLRHRRKRRHRRRHGLLRGSGRDRPRRERAGRQRHPRGRLRHRRRRRSRHVRRRRGLPRRQERHRRREGLLHRHGQWRPCRRSVRGPVHSAEGSRHRHHRRARLQPHDGLGALVDRRPRCEEVPRAFRRDRGHVYHRVRHRDLHAPRQLRLGLRFRTHRLRHEGEGCARRGSLAAP